MSATTEPVLAQDLQDLSDAQGLGRRIPCCLLDVDELHRDNHQLLRALRDSGVHPPTDSGPVVVKDNAPAFHDETAAYDKLFKDGGRPVYPITSINQVLKQPRDFHHLFGPFVDYPASFGHGAPEQVFQRQWARWRDFRSWQRDNRGLEEPGDAFETHVEETKAYFRRTKHYFEIAKMDRGVWDPTYLVGPHTRWARHLFERSWQRRYCRELGCQTLSDYEAAVKTRLARHGGAALPPLTLRADPRRQSAATTWIEYLAFECWWQDWLAMRLLCLTPKPGRLRQQLHDDGLLPCSDADAETSHRRDWASGDLDVQAAKAKEVEQRCKADVERAVAALSESDAREGRRTRSRAREEAAEVQAAEVQAAQARLADARKSRDLLSLLAKYFQAEKKLANVNAMVRSQFRLVAWVKAQLSEMLEPPPRWDESGSAPTRTRKRSVDEDEPLPAAKRRAVEHDDDEAPGRARTPPTDAAGGAGAEYGAPARPHRRVRFSSPQPGADGEAAGGAPSCGDDDGAAGTSSPAETTESGTAAAAESRRRGRTADSSAPMRKRKRPVDEDEPLPATKRRAVDEAPSCGDGRGRTPPTETAGGAGSTEDAQPTAEAATAAAAPTRQSQRVCNSPLRRGADDKEAPASCGDDYAGTPAADTADSDTAAAAEDAQPTAEAATAAEAPSTQQSQRVCSSSPRQRADDESAPSCSDNGAAGTPSPVKTPDSGTTAAAAAAAAGDAEPTAAASSAAAAPVRRSRRVSSSLRRTRSERGTASTKAVRARRPR